ncbi:restriction endonuclease subunit S [Qipengyuania sp. G39]|uniref:Restriction endonuclease subunit S n=1 Tax=Qipengyuania profundimaris TaxID=3067652 RepID=A0ABT9HL22_9SPHN|nr:restriction endonuclease subunit S [Qipengyuania sp. G39]MDP4573850.1 restriction endonuclease subunit S [Qipengyuania sp. G39]
MIPEGWEHTDLGSLSSAPITYGVVKPGPSDDEDGVLFVRGGDFPDGRINPARLRTITKEVSDQYRRTKLKGGEVLISLVGYPGACAVVPSELAGANIARQTAIIRPKKDVSTSFLVTYLRSPLGQAKLLSNVIGSAQQVINLKDLRNVSVPLPPVGERRAIADVSETWDGAIETVEALIANARAQKQALMQQLLCGKHRLPGFSGEWQRKSIDEISTRVTRRNDGTELPILTISSMSGFVRQDEKYSRYMAGKSVETYIMLNEGEFAYNKGNSKTYEFGCIFDLEGYARALVPHVYVCFKLKKGYSHRFYKALFEADYLAPQLGRLVNTGVRNNGLLNIKPSEFLGTKVPVPPIDEQDAIAAVMEAASRTVVEHETQLAALRQEKAALMQQLLTGKRRVKLPENEVA